MEAKAKMMTLVERYFSDFQKEVAKHMASFNDSTRENYLKVDDHLSQLKRDLQEKAAALASDKVLKTTISFYAKTEDLRYSEQLACIKNRIDYLETQKV